MRTETRTITIDDAGQPDWLVRLVRNLALLFPEIQRIILFGSAVDGVMHKFSDIDLAIDTGGDFTAQQWNRLTDQVHIAEKLRKVDCVHLNKAPDDLRDAILSEGKVLYVSGQA